MKKEQLSKLMLIIIFIGFSISATVSYTLGRSQADNTTAYLILVMFAVIFGVFAQIRLQEMGENKTYLFSMVITLLMIIFPFTSLIALSYLLRTPKIVSPKEVDNPSGCNNENDNSNDISDTSIINKAPSIEFGEIKRIVGLVIVIIVILVLGSKFFKADSPPIKNREVLQYNYLEYKSPITLISNTGQTLSDSYEEFLGNKTKRVSIGEYTRLDGVDLSIQYPQSWTTGKGNNERIVLKGSSATKDSIQRNFLIFISENTEHFTLNDIKLKGTYSPPGDSGIEHKAEGYVLLEGQPFSWNLYYMVREQDGINVFMQMLVYSTVMDSKFVQIQFASVSGIKGDMETDKFLERMRLKQEFLGDIKLYDAMMHSIKVENI